MVQSFFFNDGFIKLFRIDLIEFEDEYLSWSYEDFVVKIFIVMEEDDLIFGDSIVDNLKGFGGNDWLYGLGGDDMLEGGLGNDWFEGGYGNDIYVFGLGDGQDMILSLDVI